MSPTGEAFWKLRARAPVAPATHLLSKWSPICTLNPDNWEFAHQCLSNTKSGSRGARYGDGAQENPRHQIQTQDNLDAHWEDLGESEAKNRTASMESNWQVGSLPELGNFGLSPWFSAQAESSIHTKVFVWGRGWFSRTWGWGWGGG